MVDYSTGPIPTNPPSVRGLDQYIQGSSAIDPRYANYQAQGSSSSPQLNAYGTPLYSGSVLGTSTTPIVPTNTYTGQFLSEPTPGPAPLAPPSPSRPSGTQNQDYYLNEFGQPVAITGPSQEEIDAQFNPIFDVYNQAESNLRSQQPGLISEAEAQANASRSLLGNQRLGANELLGQQETATNTQRQRQSAQQRQTLQELQLANQQRFGGASSAGLGASEIQGREYQRSQYGIQENAQQALQAIGQQKQVVEREYQQGLQQLEVNKQQAVNEINRRFQDKLLEINARRGETESAKAQARLQAVQELRNQAFQINVARQQFEQELRLQAQSNMQYLDQSANQFTGASSAGSQANNRFQGYQASGMSNVQGSNQQTGGSLQSSVGSIRPEDLYGQIAGSSETDPRFQNYVPR